VATRWHALQWLMWQMGGAGPMFGQLGFFHKFAGKDFEDKRPRDRYVAESVRLLGVLERQLQGRDWVLGSDYSIAGGRAGRLRALCPGAARAGRLRRPAGGAAGPASPGGLRPPVAGLANENYSHV